MTDSALTIERLKSVLSYDPETGRFSWLLSQGNRRAGSPAGSVDGKGYLRVRIDGIEYRAHRVAWFYVHGVWPKDQIDHADLNRQNNAILNLREADNSLNNANRFAASNNTSGCKGVGYDARRNKWRAEIKKDGRVKHLGRFNDKQQAIAAYVAASAAYFGEFSRAI